MLSVAVGFRVNAHCRKEIKWNHEPGVCERNNECPCLGAGSRNIRGWSVSSEQGDDMAVIVNVGAVPCGIGIVVSKIEVVPHRDPAVIVEFYAVVGLRGNAGKSVVRVAAFVPVPVASGFS